MFDVDSYLERVLSLTREGSRNETLRRELAEEAFEYQKENCAVYRSYLALIGRLKKSASDISKIPHLPISLFKTQPVITSPNFNNVCALNDEEFLKERKHRIFTSSATTGMTPSKHYVTDISIYERIFKEGFRRVYGSPFEYHLLALLPSYLERKGASLVYMAEGLIREVRQSGGSGGFFLNDYANLLETLLTLCRQEREGGRKIILLGVSFALIDFSEFVKAHLPDYLKDSSKAENRDPSSLFKELIIIETGGMKGRGKELSPKELHALLRNNMGTENIHSEYGMAELLSQAYSVGDIADNVRVFSTPPWMEITVGDLYDPFKKFKSSNKKVSGRINIVDLANINSCCFIETEDRGTLLPHNQGFTIEGRIKNAELRGCNMLVE